MTDYLDLAVGAALLLVGYVGGRMTRRRQTASTPRAVCACQHTLGEHDPATGKCGAEARRRHYSWSGSKEGYEWVPCACVKYVGPQPVEDLFAPTFLPPAE